MKRTSLPHIGFSILLCFFSFKSSPSILSPTPETEPLEKSITLLYHAIDFGLSEKVDYPLFQRAMTGYYQLKGLNKMNEKEIISIIDFRKSGNEKRLWVIDLQTKKLLYHTLVAHGRNTGDVYAEKFSNRIHSNQSSLGFYVTGNTYMGKHGISLKLHGMEAAINDKAEARAVVMHGADYVSESYIQKVGRLGRSFGCPAIPMELHKELIPKLANGTCLYIYYPDQQYLSNTRFNNQLEASRYLQTNSSTALSSARNQ